jgi:hypothetical protein
VPDLPINTERNDGARNRLVDVLRRGNSLALVGAGVSVWAGYGSWGQVIEHLAAAVGGVRPEVDTQAIIRNNRNPLHCAQHLGQYLGPAFAAFIQTEFGPNGKRSDAVLLRLCSLPFEHFLTLNFDYSLEQIHGILGRTYQTVSTRNLSDLVKFMRCHDGVAAHRHVLHLHGTFTDPPADLALTDDGYRRLYPDGTLFRKFLWWLTTSKSLIFLGFGFTDSDFLNAIRQAAWDLKEQDEPIHFAIRGIAREDNDEAIRNDSIDTYKIEPVFYELAEGAQDRHAGFAALIEKIAADLKLPVAGPPIVIPTNAAPVAAPEPDDLRRAERLAEELVEKLDPGGDDVPR